MRRRLLLRGLQYLVVMLFVGACAEFAAPLSATYEDPLSQPGVRNPVNADDEVQGAEALLTSVGVSTTVESISIRGKKIFKGEKEFVSKGVIFEGFLETLSQLQECVNNPEAYAINGKGGAASDYCARHLESRDYFFGTKQYEGHDALSLAIAHWGINSVRFNLNQSALDHKSAYVDPEYINELKNLVRRAQDKGLVVFLALFAGRNDNSPQELMNKNPNTPIDNETTLRAAKTLARVFGANQGVVIELLNEPYHPTSHDLSWQLWANGSDPSRPLSNAWKDAKFVGVNRIIRVMRKLGSKNVIGLQALGASFADFPGLDALKITDDYKINNQSQLFYAAHPFMNGNNYKAGHGPLDAVPIADDEKNDEEIDWFNRFGQFAQSHPFVITAWGAHTNDPWCTARGPQKAQEYLDYLSKENVGVIGYALDVPWSIVKDYRKLNASGELSLDTPFGMAKEQPCEQKMGSAGELLQKSFMGTLRPLENHAPVVSNVTVPKTVYANEEATFTIVASDHEGDPMRFRIWWGDGSGAAPYQRSNVFKHIFKWRGATGSFKVNAVAIDSKGITSPSFEINVQVQSRPK